MRGRPECLLYAQDPATARRMMDSLAAVAPVRALPHADAAESAVAAGDCVLVLDLCAPGARDVLRRLVKAGAAPAVVALGAPRSEPAREAGALGVFAVVDPEADWRELQGIVTRALERAALEQEIRILREESARGPAARAPDLAFSGGRAQATWSLNHFSAALRNFKDVDALLRHIVEGIANALTVQRAGLFATVGDGSAYRLRAERNCLEATRRLAYDAGDPLVGWMERHAHVISRAALAQIGTPHERPMLARALDATGAEALAPLFARGRLLGWFFVGHRAAGCPFNLSDLEDLSALSEHVATTIENALLYEEVALQKTLAETLLHAIPTGIVAVGEGGAIRWFNRAAESMLGIRAEAARGQPVECAGSVLADLLRRAMAGDDGTLAAEWEDRASDRAFSATVRRLADGEVCVGAMALIENLTEKRRLAAKEEQLDRSIFWTDLAAAMSHEIRNPLVAIKTFAQLLPERYADAEFRDEFSRQVSDEVDRLNHIADEISSFAHPPAPAREVLDVPALLGAAMEAARTRCPHVAAPLNARILSALPEVVADPVAVADAMMHLATNALESYRDQKPKDVLLTAALVLDHPRGRMLELAVEDHGRGIPLEIKDRIFSPFCTTKARGMGLGLPIVRRTVLDHGGEIRIQSSHEGTRVAILLPADASPLPPA